MIPDPSRPGWVRNAANDWTVRFGPVSAGGAGGVELVTDGGVARFAPELPALASPIAPVVAAGDDSTTVTYPEVWPGVDVRYTVSSSRVKEEIVVENGSRSSFPFVTEGLGLTEPASESASAAGLDDEGPDTPLTEAPEVTGAQAGRVALAPLTVTAPGGELVGREAGTSVSVGPVAGSSAEQSETDASGAAVTEAGAGAQRLTVSVDEAWMAEQADAAEPVVIDPTFEIVHATDYLKAFRYDDFNGDLEPCFCGAQTGRFFDTKFRSAARFPYWDRIVGRDIISAGIWLGNRSQGARYTDEWGGEHWVPALSEAWLAAVPLGESEPNFHSVPFPRPPYFEPIATDYAEDGAILDVTPELVNAQLAQDPYVWWGLTGDEEDNFSFAQFDTVMMVINVNRKPPAAPLVSPAHGALAIDTLTPVLKWAPVSGDGRDADGDLVKYVAKISTGTDGESGLVAQSLPFVGTEWQVPAGVLKDGVTYYWKVSTGDYKPDDAAQATSWTGSSVRMLTVDRRSSLSPSDSLGAVSTNLVTGAPKLTVPGPRMPAVGGGVGVDFVYNGKQSLTGLTGTYRDDANKNGEIEASDPVRLVRTDSQVVFDWGEGAASPGVPGDWFSVRWAGTIRFPSEGTWVVGERSDDGARIRINGGLVVNEWGGGVVEHTPVWQPDETAFAAGSRHRISVDYREHVGPAQMELWAKNTLTGQAFKVPADWLSPDQPDMAPGWTLVAADANVSYIRATISEGSVTLVGTDGEAFSFTKQPDGTYKAPEGFTDLLVVNVDGTVTVHDDAGFTYTFNNDGTLAAIRTALDDRRPAAAKPSYDSDGHLTEIRDPVSGRSVEFVYADEDHDLDCPNEPLNDTKFESKQGLLCRINYWDGTKTDLYYFKATGLLSHVVNPGGTFEEQVWHSFSYDDQGRMVRYHDPVAKDALWLGGRSDSDSTRLATEIEYFTVQEAPGLQGDRSRVKSIKLPFAMQPDTQRVSRGYGYAPNAPDGILANGSASVTRGGVPSIFRAVDYDHRGRGTKETNAAGQSSFTYWDSRDLVVATKSPDDLMTATWYNNRLQPTDVWGPAPSNQFKTVNVGTILYEPVDANCSWSVPAWNETCGLPWARTGYDEGPSLAGLQARWWNNRTHVGSPVLHQFDPNELSNPVPGASLPDVLFNAPEPEGVSARYEGDVVAPGPGSFQMRLCLGVGDAAWLYVDGRLVTSHWRPFAADVLCPDFSEAAGVAFAKAGETHSLRIDYMDLGVDNPHVGLAWKHPGGFDEPVPGANLRPAYSLATSTTDADGKKTTTQYVDGNVGPQHGLVTSTVVNPELGGLGLTETTTYEQAGGSGGYLRRLTHTLPAGAATATSNAYYPVVDDPATTNKDERRRNDPCTTADGTDPYGWAHQGGMVHFDKAADPDGTGAKKALWREMIYDKSGRVVASRTGDEGTLIEGGGPAWICTAYDGRGRATQVVYPAYGGQPARTVTNNYRVDPDGSGPRVASPLVTSVSDAAGTITVETDLLGRGISYKDVFGNTTTFQYDLLGREIQNSGPVGVVTKSYDNADRMTQISRGGQVLANGFNYDPVSGRLLGVTYPSGAGNAGNGTTGTFDYNANTGRLSKITWRGPGGTLLTSDEVFRTRGGDIDDQIIDGTVDPNPGRQELHLRQGRTSHRGVGARTAGAVQLRQQRWVMCGSEPGVGE